MDKALEKVFNELKKDKDFADLTDKELLEMAELELKAKANYKNYVVAEVKPDTDKPKKAKTVKVSDAKQELFADILQFLNDTYEGVTVVRDNKLIQVEFDNKIFKVDLVEQRPPKKV